MPIPAASYNGVYPIHPLIITQHSHGEEYETTVQRTGGFEQANADLSQGYWRVGIGGGVIHQRDVRNYHNFHRVIQGRAGRFLFRLRSAAFAMDDDLIGTGDGVETEFQCKSIGSYQGFPTERIWYFLNHNYPVERVTHPEGNGPVISKTKYLTIKVNDIELSYGDGDWDVDRMTGIVTFTAPPANGATIKATGETFFLARYSQDWNPIATTSGKKYEIPGGIEVYEPRGPQD